ncbi:MAG: hypothetical protein JWR39_47 [Devosia sp.]|nr:hypothetical protein [Devosia sp.]
MFFPSDNTTEILAHFLGYFELAVEAARTRLDYQQIEVDAQPAPENGELEQLSANAVQKFDLGDYTPGVRYVPPDWDIRGSAEAKFHALPPPEFEFAPGEPAPELPVSEQQLDGAPALPMLGPVPGGVLAIIEQQAILVDDDIVILGNYSGAIQFNSGAGFAIAAMQLAADDLVGAVTGSATLHAYADVGAFVVTTAEFINSFGAEGGSNDHTTVHVVQDIDGIYVNGQLVLDAPSLEDALPDHLNEAMAEEDETDAESGSEPASAYHLGGSDAPQSVTLHSGGNFLVNEANIFNASVTTAILAVNGDIHQLDAIIQTNLYSDIDTVDLELLGSAPQALASTLAYNIAEFTHEVRDATGDAAALNPGMMPSNWIVSVVEGDMVFVEWMSQFTFQSDQDFHVLTATGSTTLVTSGENVGMNAVNFATLGLHYDLIIIGGALFDANIIVQTNILYDNDVLEMLAGTIGRHEASSGGNLLWNEASIHNIGADTFVDGMPGHYNDAMTGLAAGDYRMPEGFSTDSQFEGYGALRVLFIKGDVYDLRYVEQTNVLGDADYVGLQQAQIQAEHPDIEWNITTGANALVNAASITDHDGLGNTAYLNGEHYSDAILIQADILYADSASPNGDILVTEVIAFLDTDLDLDLVDTAAMGPMPMGADGAPADIMQTVLA